MRGLLLSAVSVILIAVASPIAQAYDQTQVNLVASWYGRYLGRAPEPDGLAGHLHTLNFRPAIAVEAGILASQEYALRTGYSDAGFVAGLYRDVLGAAASPAQINVDVQRLYQLRSREAFAMEFLQRPRNVIVASAPVTPDVCITPPPAPMRIIPPPTNLYRPAFVPSGPHNHGVVQGPYAGYRYPNFGYGAYYR
jgi:hypothetical protein